MFAWFSLDDLKNGLLVEVIAMAVEIFVIVKVIEWRRRKEENLRMTRFRSMARKQLRRSLADLLSKLKSSRTALTRFSNEIGAASSSEIPIAFPSEAAEALKQVQAAYDRLGRDFALFMPGLDEATYAIHEAAIGQLEWMLNVWLTQRLTDPAFEVRWLEDPPEKRLPWFKTLDEVRRAVAETIQIESAIDAMLNYAETQEGGDAALLNTASQIASGTHACSRAREWKHILDPPPHEGVQG